MKENERTGIFVGSFNPFTIGHLSVVTRALPLFDRLVIGVVGQQQQKPGQPTAEERVENIKAVFRKEEKVEVKPYYGLAVDFALKENAHYIVKGVRSVKDFEYEREQADINRQITDGKVETILFLSEQHLSSVSSSMVRELQHYGFDVAPFLP